ncbi:MAG: glycosyltransferase [Sphingomonadales bacterium]|nr:glycosyltransferase [Sphingomonadales bacterium]
MKILVVTARYTVTGVPLAQARFAAALAEAGHAVDYMVGLRATGRPMPVIPGVRSIELNSPKTRNMAAALWRYLRRERPDVVFAAEDHLTCVVLAAAVACRSRARISGSSRVPPFDTYSDKVASKRWLLKQAMRALAWRADALTCVSQDMVAQYQAMLPGMGHQCVYNIIDKAASLDRMAEPLDDPWFADGLPPPIVAAGSLAPYKGFADLIHAMALLQARAPQARLVILGEGPLRAELEALVARLGLTDRVRLPGRVANPLRYFSRARVFALSSHFEGMPNVLVEAMMCGCTPVAADCPTGPRELLQDGRFGYLVRKADPAHLADGLCAALARPVAPELLEEAIAPFAQDRVIARHFALLGLADAAIQSSSRQASITESE